MGNSFTSFVFNVSYELYNIEAKIVPVHQIEKGKVSQQDIF